MNAPPPGGVFVLIGDGLVPELTVNDATYYKDGDPN
jgi:hypothetical protein